MRDYLFRGKRVDNGEWVEGFYVQVDNKAYISLLLDISGDGVITMFDEKQSKAHLYTLSPFLEVVPETVGQYTGLTDKNGKKIFEGDIIERYERGITEPHNLYPTEKAKVGWNNAFTEFRANIIDLYHEEENLGEFIQGCEIEVIGNIHDNPELLEAKV